MGRLGLAAIAVALAASPVGAQELMDSAFLRTTLHGVAQVDWNDEVDVRRARLGIKGEAFQIVEYEIERDFREAHRPWRDVYINVPLRRLAEVRVGRFKVPFGAEQLTGISNLDFVSRSMASMGLSPGRDTGVMLHGRISGRTLHYQVGLFRSGGDNLRSEERRYPRHPPLVAARVVIKPWSVKGDRRHDVAFGAASTSGRIPEGPYSLDAHTFDNVPTVPALMVAGNRVRLGAEIEWRYGPLRVDAEFIRAIDERVGQAVDDSRLSSLTLHGWYLSTAVKPVSSLKRLDIVARVEELVVHGAAGGPVIDSPRSPGIAPTSDRAVTGGSKWAPVKVLTLYVNLIRQWRAPASPSTGARWKPAARLQVAW